MQRVGVNGSPARRAEEMSRRSWVLINDYVRQASPGTGLPSRLERNRFPHGCVAPLWWTRLDRQPAGRHLWTVHMADERTPKTA